MLRLIMIDFYASVVISVLPRGRTDLVDIDHRTRSMENYNVSLRIDGDKT